MCPSYPTGECRMDDLAKLDEQTQRRLTLQAFKQIKGSEFAEDGIRQEQPTIAEFGSSTRNWVIGLAIGAPSRDSYP